MRTPTTTMSRTAIRECPTPGDVQLVVHADVSDGAGVAVSLAQLLGADTQAAPQLIRPIPIGQSITDGHLLVRDWPAIPLQGQLDVSRIESRGQARYLSPTSTPNSFLQNSDPGTHWAE
ncbi:hypothetical protein AAFF_G00276150 [Aldrovandia affinis]|uniref:Uncharacterized protein n=1 Tax=Aldrovandia affinis TaxID=143900 RepID=A0AAD7RAH1_9TELE|nr:hypothetical protein AAFF_G00276150 [Aldrovandia affinis]